MMFLWLSIVLAELVLVSSNVISCGGFVETLNNAGRTGIKVSFRIGKIKYV